MERKHAIRPHQARDSTKHKSRILQVHQDQTPNGGIEVRAEIGGDDVGRHERDVGHPAAAARFVAISTLGSSMSTPRTEPDDRNLV